MSNDENWLPVDDPEESAALLGALMTEHADRTADRVLEILGGALNEANLSAYLEDDRCLRRPTRIVYSDNELESHQFGEPVVDRHMGACELRIRTALQRRTDLLPFFVAYLSPVINYGPIVSSELCETYGAKLTGLSTDQFYDILCDAMDGLADT